jgi:hypothetical protein
MSGPLTPGDESGSASHYLRLFNDVRYFVGDGEEMRDRWLSGERRNWAESYVKGDLEVVLRLSIKGSGEVADLVFSAVPYMRKHGTSGWKLFGSNVSIGAFKTNAGQKTVLAAITELVENPDGAALPSLVRLEQPKEREDIRWQILAAASAYHVRFELRGGVGDREVAGFGFPFATEDRRFVSKVIQGSSQMLDNLDDPQIKDGWGVFRQPAFVRFCQAIRVRLGEKDVWTTLPEGFPFDFERVEQFLCASDPNFGTKKWLRHELRSLALVGAR